MHARSASAAVIVLSSALVFTSCSSPAIDPESVAGIPESWLTETAEGWPDSDAFGGTMPVLSRDRCLLVDKAPQILDGGAKLTETGWDPYGNDDNGYRYLCGVHLSGSYAGELQLIRASDSIDAAQTLSEFENQASNAQQENSVSEITSGQLDMLVLTRWYPTNPQGMYQALYFDEGAKAFASLEINSLDDSDFDMLTPQDVADALVQAMASAG